MILNYFDVKNKILKVKKYYFNIFSVKKHFKKYIKNKTDSWISII
jgi:hypothetical protein